MKYLSLILIFFTFLGLAGLQSIFAGEITAFSHGIVYPSLKFRILGKNFPCDSDSLKVYLGERESKVLKCRDYEIVIQIPDMKREGYYPITIATEEKNIDSNKTVQFLYVD